VTARPLLRLVPPAEPFSPRARRADEPCDVIDSPARRRLIREIHRYVCGDISGRSFLVSGHRGAGKTTMVLSAIEEVTKDCRAASHRPLPVRLNAPDLMAVLGLDESERPVGLLKQLALALTKSVGDEFVRCFTQIAGSREHREIAAELRIEIEEAPSLEDVRQVWEHFGVIQRGALFGHREGEDHGLLEIAALWRSLQVHARVSGDLKTGQGETNTEEHQRKTETTYKLDVGKAANQLLAVVVGGLVGAALYTKESPFLGAASGLISAALASLTFQFYDKWEWTQTRERTRSFAADTSLGSLSRLLPRLVEQLREIGLAPVFVVDELDKVDDAADGVGRLVEKLKSFVTEQSFFLFLADRSYHEYIEARKRTTRFPVEHTYFSDQLFLTYRPHDLHRYLDKIMRPDAALDAEATRAALDDREILRHVLLCRSRLHLYDLRAELQGRVRDEDVLVNSESRPDNATAGQEVYFQLAIERVLDDERLDRRMRDDSHFAQRVLDALYTVPEHWRRQEDLPLDLRDLVEAVLEDDVLLPPDETLVVEAVTALVGHLVDHDDFVRQIRKTQTHAARGAIPPVSLLESRGDAYTWLLDPNGEGDAWKNLPFSPTPPEPEPEPRRDLAPAGAAMGGAAPPTQRAAQMSTPPRSTEWVGRYAEEIRVVDRGVAMVTGGHVGLGQIATDFGGVPTTPSWDRVEAALERERAGELTHEGARAIREYARRLRAHVVVLSHALLWAAAVRAISRTAGRSPRWSDALRTLSRALRFRESDRLWLTEQLEPDQLTQMLAHLGVQIPPLGRVVPRDAADWAPIKDAAEQIEAAVANAGELKTPAAAWKSARSRVYAFLDKPWTATPHPSLTELACIAGHTGPARYLYLSNLETADWSAVLSRVEAALPDDSLRWIQAAALIKLGQADEVVERTGLPRDDRFVRLARRQKG